MRKAGHSGKLEYDQNVANRIQETSDNNRPLPTKRVNRGRNITYYNPPYHQLLLTNLSYTVRRITGECFTKDHILAKILNKNTIKTTYCTTPNMASKIRQHNNKVLKKEVGTDTRKQCNCHKDEECPLEGNCIHESVIYQAQVEHTGNKELNKWEQNRVTTLAKK